MTRFLLTILLIAIGFFHAEGQHKISGIVRDGTSQEVLSGATVRILETSDITATDTRGSFHLQLPAYKTITLTINHIGYEPHTTSISTTANGITKIYVNLTPGELSLQQVEVVSNNNEANALSQIDINLRPGNTSQDVLRMVPGLFIAQHAGGGKAEQIFLRGFDIDHGTDINLEVDGLPVNMVSHAHGQGYSDLHFLIPEIINIVDFNKGPYYADKGDFTTAGYVSFITENKLNENFIKSEGGRFGTFRNVTGLNLFDFERNSNRQNAFIATELFRSNGYFESPQGFTRFNGTAKYRFISEDGNQLVASFSTFTSRWNASGQIPERAVNTGMISRFGAIDDTEGGQTSRTQGYLNSSLPMKGGLLENKAYVIRYDFDLFSNFTFFLNNREDGDQIRQRESRMIYGYNTRYGKTISIGGHEIQTELGAGFRFDNVKDIRLSNTKNRNTLISDISSGDVRESNVNGFVNTTIDLTENISLNTGLRLDHFTFIYQDELSEVTNAEGKSILSPKLSLQYQANANTSLFLRSGFGFHSNDARVVSMQKGKQVLPRAFGLDIGTMTKITPRLVAHLALWMLDLEQEFVYVGDEGVVEPSGRSRRMGIDVSLRYQLNPWLFADGDFNYTYGRSKDDPETQNYLPLAPVVSSLGGLTAVIRDRLQAAIRYRYLGDRPANEDNSAVAKGYGLLDAALVYHFRKLEFNLTADNLLDSNWKEAQFNTESRLKDEADPVSEIHFTPGTPFFIKAGVTFKF